MKRPVVVLGTFDGVHRGHQKLIASARKFAKKNKVPVYVITFDPHPQQFIRPERGLKLLTTLDLRKKLILAEGADRVITLKFDQQMRKMDAGHFVKNILVKRLKAYCVFVGFDYAFGQGRVGGINKLKELGREFDFKVKVVAPVKTHKHMIKSRIIREMISKGKFHDAVHLLGHPYYIWGRVTRGEGRGKKLGFPTANLKVDRHKLVPAHGVYSGYVVLGKKKHKAVINIGARPTFGRQAVAVEVHILGFNGNLRNKQLRLALLHRLRDERQFSDVEKLKAQIKKDVARTRKM